jgi:TonB family protein
VRGVAQILLTFLFNAAWQILLIAATATLCDWLLRGASARYRHAIWVIALVLSLLLPALSSFGTLPKHQASPQTPAAEIAAVPTVVTRISTIDGEEIQPAKSPLADAPDAPALTQPEQPRAPSRVSVNRRVAGVVFALYGLFILYACLRFFRAWCRTHKIIRTAFEPEMPALVQAVIETCRRVIKTRRVRILSSPAIPVPITAGFVRPLIILPAPLFDETDKDVLISGISHELVHVARHDYLANLIYEFLYLPLSFHPAAWSIQHRIRQTRELCCDEWVAAKLLRPDVYARSLVRLIGTTPLMPRMAADTTIGISESDNLEVRIMSLLKTRKLTARRKAFLLFLASLLLAAPCLAATSFALNFEINGQAAATPQQSRQKLEQKDQERARRELQRQLEELRKQERLTTGERAEFEAVLREVRLALEEHEKFLKEYEQQTSQIRPEIEAGLKELQKGLQEHERLLEQYQKQGAEQEKLSAAEKRLVELLTKYPYDPMREEISKLLEKYQSGSGDGQKNRQARVIYRVEPKYPDDAREKQITGSVVLTLTVDHDGNPQNIAVKKSLYPSMDQAAIEAARKMRFEPAMKDGQVVSAFLQVEFYFSMESKRVEVMRAGEGAGQGEGWGTAEWGQSEYGGGVREMRMREERTAQEDRARTQAELVQGATISMDRAIQIATSKFPGKVLACSLGRDKDGPVFYHLVIINTDGDKRSTRYVWISAIDGTIIKTEDEAKASSISAGVLNGKAISLPNATYPEIARAARAEGDVIVQITIDEQGNVTDAQASWGHPLLQAAAVKAARQAKFKPTYLQGVPVTVKGQLVYNFVIQ